MMKLDDFNPNEYSKEYVGMFFEQLYGKDVENITGQLEVIHSQLEQDIIFAKQEHEKAVQMRLKKETIQLEIERLDIKNIFKLVELDNLSVEEIAERLDLGLDWVKKVISEKR